jgi:hypothetical protein
MANKPEARMKALEEERQEIYGPPETYHQAIALAWEGYLLNKRIQMLTAADVANMHVLAKTIRLAYTPDHVDSHEDRFTYAGFAQRFARVQ